MNSDNTSRRNPTPGEVPKPTKSAGFGWLFVVFVSLAWTSGNAQTWIQLSPIGGPPQAREFHVSLYDPTTNRMVVHGGLDGTFKIFGDAWVLSNADGSESTAPTWSQLLPINPLTRFDHTGIYDPSSNRIVVFGGKTSIFNQANDVWVLTNANGSGGNPAWLQLTPSGALPLARSNARVVYDGLNNRMIMFGGDDSSNGGVFGDVWVLTNANGTESSSPMWIQLVPTSQIPPRTSHSEVYDAANNRMIVFGGCANPLDYSDVWVLTNANGLGGSPAWIQLVTKGEPPAERCGAASGYDAATNRMLIFGGANSVNDFSDAWVLTNANNLEASSPTWIASATSGTVPAARRAMGGGIYADSSNRLGIFGGSTSCCGTLNDSWVLDNAIAIPAVVGLSSTALTFPVQLVGTTSKRQSVSLTNSGDGDLIITSISVSGDFTQSNNCGSNIQPGAICTIVSAFRPSTQGRRTGTITITDNAGDSPQHIALSGTGTVVAYSPRTLDFGNQMVGTTSQPETVTVTNSGTGLLSFSGFTIIGSNATDFTETNTCGTPLAQGQSCTVSVKFTPSAMGSRQASLNMADNGGGSPQRVTLTGTGI